MNTVISQQHVSMQQSIIDIEKECNNHDDIDNDMVLVNVEALVTR